MEVEIVGVVERLKHEDKTGFYSVNSLFLPSSLPPEELRPSLADFRSSFADMSGTANGATTEFSQEELARLLTERRKTPSFWGYSFVLKHPLAEEAFLKERKSDLKGLGMSVYFEANRAASFFSSAETLRRSSALNLVLQWLLLLAFLALVVFFYLYSQRRAFAIARAMGMRRRSALVRLLLPLLVVAFSAFALAVLLSQRYARTQAARNLSALESPEGLRAVTSLSFLFPFALILFLGGLFCIFAVFGAFLLSQKSTLALLRGAEQTHIRKAAKASDIQGDGTEKKWQMREREQAGKGIRPLRVLPLHFLPSELSEALRAAQEERKGGSQLLSLFFRYEYRMLLRSGWKSLLLFTLAAIFLFANGWMRWAMEERRQNLDRLYDQTELSFAVTSLSGRDLDDSGIIKKKMIEQLEALPYFSKRQLLATARREGVAAIENGGLDPTRRAFPNCIPLYGLEEPSILAGEKGMGAIRYAENWDASFFSKQWSKEELNALPGIPAIFPRHYIMNLGLRDGDVVSVWNEIRERRLFMVGDFDDPKAEAGKIPSHPFLLPLSALEQMEPRLYYKQAEWVLDSRYNRRLDEIRAILEPIVFAEEAGLLPLNLVVRDDELRQVVEPLKRGIALLALLYPLSLGISTISAAGLSLLFILQRAKDACIQRILGLRRRVVNLLLCSDLLFLNLTGMAFELLLLLASRYIGNGSLCSLLLTSCVYFSASLLGATLAARMLSRRKPLELLQGSA